MIWYKYRATWAWGNSSWEYGYVRESHLESMEMDFDEYFKECVGEGVDEKHGWSDKYRGYEWLQIDEWPIELLETRVDEYASRAASYVDLHLEFAEILKERKKNAV